MTSWGHDGAVVSVTNLLITLNDALTHSAVLVQVNNWYPQLISYITVWCYKAYGWQREGELKHISFPFDDPTSGLTAIIICVQFRVDIYVDELYRWIWGAREHCFLTYFLFPTTKIDRFALKSNRVTNSQKGIWILKSWYFTQRLCWFHIRFH